MDLVRVLLLLVSCCTHSVGGVQVVMPTQVTFEARNFRKLRHLHWSPGGVCLLAGPNGAGKSTTLDAIRFLHLVFTLGHEKALDLVGGVMLRTIGVDDTEPVECSITVGDVQWLVRLPVSTSGLKGTYGEELRVGQEVIARAAMFDEGWYLKEQRQHLDKWRCCARVVWDLGVEPRMKPLVDFLEEARWYPSYWLNRVKEPRDSQGPSRLLHWSGQNLWSVLSNWQGSPMRSGQRFDWVMHHARQAFPDQIKHLEFHHGRPFLYGPDSTDPEDGLPSQRVADGVLIGLLHLTAVAGAPEGSLLTFDEVENQLHPHAIRYVLQAMRERAESQDLTIVLTTHSPVVMNEFMDEPEEIFVLSPHGQGETVPRRLSELHDSAWLAQAKIGTLYDRLAFGAPGLGVTEG